jgi:exonuclease III
MSLFVPSINVNGLRYTKKRNCSFLWLIKHRYDGMCLQETIELVVDTNLSQDVCSWGNVVPGGF